MGVLSGSDPVALAQAARRLADGGLVAFPTETVYGLGARADDDAAVAGIYAAKGRPADHPLIVHVADWSAAQAYTDAPSPLAQRLVQAFWPGPVTLIAPRRPGIGTAAAGGQDSIGLRCPAHPVAQALLRAALDLGVTGVAAPSANRFGRVSPTCAAHVAGEFGPQLLILDGGDCPVGIESTIIDTRGTHPVLLRPGLLDRPTLEAALGDALSAPDRHAPRASGTLESHYAPTAPVWLASPQALRTAAPAGALSVAEAADRALTSGSPTRQGLAVYSRARPAWPHRLWRPMPEDAAALAHELFAVLRTLDEAAVAAIVVEQPPAQPDWEGVNDRLRRAATR
ncbi:MAG: hypothetical protein RLY78_3951 [Pseudomonadota bacterium]|uniref:Threonylcarbamoyl-AMP synthase n=1 Tax=Pseudaquabacterium rugosum TaxID=2984194 RepID=A0ABU9B7D2_9BURK